MSHDESQASPIKWQGHARHVSISNLKFKPPPLHKKTAPAPYSHGSDSQLRCVGKRVSPGQNRGCPMVRRYSDIVGRLALPRSFND